MCCRSPWTAASARSAPSTSPSARSRAPRPATSAAKCDAGPASTRRRARPAKPATTDRPTMRGRRPAAILFGLAVMLTLLGLRAADPYPVRVARETSFDLFQQLKPRPAPADLPIRIVDIDEASLAAWGQWPWSRSLLAELAGRAMELGAAVVAFDVLFSEPDRLSGPEGRDHDAALAQVLAQGPGVLALARNAGANLASLLPKAGLAVTGADPLPSLPELGGVVQPLPALADVASGLGVASLDDGGA